MGILHHAAWAAAYVVGAAGAAAAAGTVPALAANATPAYAVAAVMAGAFLHHSWARSRRERRLEGEVQEMRRTSERLERELVMARRGMVEIREALREGVGTGRRVAEVAAEVEVLQKLVDQLWVRHGPGDAPEGGDGVWEGVDADQTELLDVVRSALALGRVQTYLQPVVSLPQRRLRFYECFSRIHDGAGELVTADRYIPLAEQAGLAPAIDNMLLFRCVQLVRRAQERNASVGFFCNVSRHSLADQAFLSDFADFVETNPQLARSLVFELAQPEIDLADPTLAACMADLARLGVRFSLDRVQDLELDAPLLASRNVRFVKLDAALFRGEGAGTRDLYLDRLRRELARQDIELVIEKIESEEELVELLEYDVGLGQGYLFGAPRPGPEV